MIVLSYQHFFLVDRPELTPTLQTYNSQFANSKAATPNINISAYCQMIVYQIKVVMPVLGNWDYLSSSNIDPNFPGFGYAKDVSRRLT